MALPNILRRLFKSDGYGPELNDGIVSKAISIQDWDSSYNYSINSVCKAGGGIFRAVAATGPGTSSGAVDPAQDDGTYWVAMPLDDSSIVHTSENENIAGEKTFINTCKVKNSDPLLYFECTDVSSSGTVGQDVTKNPGFYFLTNNGGPFANLNAVIYQGSTGLSVGLNKYNSLNDRRKLEFIWHSSNNLSELFVGADNTTYLGLAAYRWKSVYAATGTIQTSDERCKSAVSSIPDEVLDAWGSVSFVQFKFNDAIEEKGGDARLHSGVIAQRISNAFSSAGLDASRYGFFCWDQWDAKAEERDENGNIISNACEKGDRYSIRYEEALCMEAAYQRRRADRAEARLAALEERLAAIEAKLG